MLFMVFLIFYRLQLLPHLGMTLQRKIEHFVLVHHLTYLQVKAKEEMELIMVFMVILELLVHFQIKNRLVRVDDLILLKGLLAELQTKVHLMFLVLQIDHLMSLVLQIDQLIVLALMMLDSKILDFILNLTLNHQQSLLLLNQLP